MKAKISMAVLFIVMLALAYAHWRPRIIYAHTFQTVVEVRWEGKAWWWIATHWYEGRRFALCHFMAHDFERAEKEIDDILWRLAHPTRVYRVKPLPEGVYVGADGRYHRHVDMRAENSR